MVCAVWYGSPATPMFIVIFAPPPVPPPRGSMRSTPQNWNPFVSAPNQVWVDPGAPRLGTTSNVIGTPGIIGGRAAGGPVSPRKPYMVGEHGPELFTPQGAGNIGGGAGTTVVINIGVAGDPYQTAQAIADLLRQYEMQNGTRISGVSV